MKISRRQLSKLINETMKPTLAQIKEAQEELGTRDLTQVSNWLGAHEDEVAEILGGDNSSTVKSGSGNKLSNDWMSFVMRNPRYQETLLHVWEHLIDGDDPKATKQIYLNDLDGNTNIANAITFYGRRIKEDENYLTGKEIGEAIAAERERREIAKNNAPPSKPAKTKPYGGGTQYRPYGRST